MTANQNKNRQIIRHLALALLGTALLLPLAGCQQQESGNRYNLMYRSERERLARPETVGKQAGAPVISPTQDQPDKATHGIIN